MTDRKAFNFYKSYYDVAMMLPIKDRGEFLTAIIEAQFTGKIIEPKGKLAKLAFTGQRHSIEKQLEGYKNGLLTPHKTPSKGASKSPLSQVQGEVQVQEKEEVQYVNNEHYLRDPSTFQDATCKSLHITIKEYLKHLDTFCIPNDMARDEKELKSHFFYWLKKQDLNTNEPHKFEPYG